MANNINITSKGIQKILQKYTPEQAICEYIWNGFDAKASTINLNYFSNPLGGLETIEIVDNGYGINFEELNVKFNPFYESEKAIEFSVPVHTSLMHGRNGVGRLTFFTFSHTAEWVSTFKSSDKISTGRIEINSNSLNSYKPEIIAKQSNNPTGTKVRFSNIEISSEYIESIVVPYLISEFCWFIELNATKEFKIFVNGQALNFSQNIIDSQSQSFIYEKSNTVFNIKYIQWETSLHKELSKNYFLNSQGNEVYKDFTTLNKKGDDFFHSVYIESNFFDNFNFKSSENDNQTLLFGKAKSSPEYKFLIRKVNELLRARRKPYLRLFAEKLFDRYEQDGIFPTYKYEWEEKFKKPQLEEVLIGLYEAEPKLFTSLNNDQKKTFVRLLDVLLDSNERETIFHILDEIIDLDTEERRDLATLFKTTRLSSIIETIKLIEDRYITYYKLKDLVFNSDLKANEVNHLQKLIEKHYWLFGEQYHLVTAAEPKFEEALRRYQYLLTEKDISTQIDHAHKYKEMDIFACRQSISTNKIENIVIELKHPMIALGEEQYSQVHKYLQVISNQVEFNAKNMSWEFYLIGNKFNTSKYVEDLIETNKNHGIPALALFKDNGRIKVYVKTWSEVFTDFEIKHKYLNERLKLERDKLLNELTSVSEIIESVETNLAIQPEEIKVPIRK